MRTKVLEFVFLISIPVFAQVEMQESYSYTPPHFYFDALNFRANQKDSRMDFYLQVPLDEIEFVKYGNEFRGSYEISLKLSDEDGNIGLEQAWDVRPICESFDETTSRSIFSSSEKQFVIKPGNYTLQVTLTDSETGKSFTAKRNFTARNYSDSTLSLSDIMLLKSASASGGKEAIVPNIEGNVISEQDSFPIFYEVYLSSKEDSAFITTEIRGGKDKVVSSNSKWLTGAKETERIVSHISKDSIPMGIYKLTISLRESSDKELPAIAEASRLFTIHFPDLPITITNLDKAAEEMMYVANSKTIDSIKTGENMFIKEKRFLDFWKKYNPNPSARENTIMDEYFNRVAYANEHFTHYFQGWKTDMGMIYILFGPPNSVDRHPFEVDTKPYEIWNYYQTNKQFVFVDESGFGDYRLITPLSDVYSPPYGPNYIGK